VTLRIGFQEPRASDLSAPPRCCAASARLEKALAAGRFAAQADTLRLYRSIATMDKSAPLPPLRNQKPT
jgi:hypothetical protein